MSLFDRFVSKGTGEQEKKSFLPTPYMRLFSVLDLSGKRAKTQHPDDSVTVDDFVWALKEACRARYKNALNDPSPLNAESRFFLSKDRMTAYACVLPPENEGEGITLEGFLEDMHYEGIHYGVLQEKIRQDFALGYLHIFPVARGKPPQAGEDGKVTELFQRRRNMGLEGAR